MNVLTKDLCKPEVVAAIAKIGYFQIEDRPNLTTEMWEKFRDMNRNVHHTSPVNPVDLEAKLRNCSPRLSEPPTPPDDCSSSLSQTPIEGPEERLERFKFEAKQAYDNLIKMGGRPTRPIQPLPPLTEVVVGGVVKYRYAEQHEEYFYDASYGYEPLPNDYLTETDFIKRHWFQERGRCNEELRRWQNFHDTQQWRRKNRPQFKQDEDMERQRYPQDPQLTASLKKLKEWKEYQGYFQRFIDRCKQTIERARQAVEAIQRKDPEVVVNSGKVRRISREDWLDTIEEQGERLAAEEKRLEWVKKQLPVVLSECAASLTELPASLRLMEERIELEAKQVYSTLMDTGGGLTRPIRPVPDVYDAEHTDEHVHALCHWEGECSFFEEELREWSKFLAYWQKKRADGQMDAQLTEHQCSESPTQAEVSKDYRAYQCLEVENIKQWVGFWQQQVNYFLQEEDLYARQGARGDAYRMYSQAEKMQSHVEEARKQVGPAEANLEWVEQQLSALLAGCAISTTQVSTFDPRDDQAKLPERASRSGQTALKGLKSNRLARRINHSKEKGFPSVNSALGPIHSSKVSKDVGRKALRLRRRLTISAERDDGQNQELDITISPPQPADIAPRRSRGSSTSQKSSIALEGDSAAELERNAQPQSTEIMLDTSDRISKQKERIGFPPSKSKDQFTGTKPDRSWGKPRGITKTRGKGLLSRKRATTNLSLLHLLNKQGDKVSRSTII